VSRTWQNCRFEATTSSINYAEVLTFSIKVSVFGENVKNNYFIHSVALNSEMILGFGSDLSKLLKMILKSSWN
jgi:hypothetical protein